MRRRQQAYNYDISRGECHGKGSVRAVLGPTNTGKTHFAIDRMLGHSSGMIGFPLRLLARENYDRIVTIKGAKSVALITGEEKLIPSNPHWFVCTVESMPLDRPVEFLAVDEIQLCADVDRGHIFTDRLLHARGLSETIFLGSDIMGPILRSLVHNIWIENRTRMSTLSYAGAANLSRLPRRSAIVGFSVDRVYELAERVRRQRGGAAVVLGALSPRTRNAQVAMYEAGEVDYMIATDAIGMGLNMGVNHIAFSGLRKFDGRHTRMLSPVEVGQIAGRAGRHMNNGSFGTTAGHGPLSPELVEAVESHHFDPVRAIFWRSRDLDFATPKRLLQSLGHRPDRPELTRAREAEDQSVLAVLARDKEVTSRANNHTAVSLLWDVCQIPDFRKIMPDHHANFVRQVYLHLTGDDSRLPEDWVSSQIDRLDAISGDINALTARLADIRTWTYISHRSGWLADPAYWQGRTGTIEDTLSDVLHERLTLRFVDRHAASIDRKKSKGSQLLSAVTAKGDVIVEGHLVGRIEGLEFAPLAEIGFERKSVLAAARRAASESIGAMVRRLLDAPDEDLVLTDTGRFLWKGAAIAQLVAGTTPLTPEVRVTRSELLNNIMKVRIRARLAKRLKVEIQSRMKTLTTARNENLPGPARGIIYRLAEHLGSLPEPLQITEWRMLDKNSRSLLSRLGVRITPAAVYFPALQEADAIRIRRLLWTTFTGHPTPTADNEEAAWPAGQLSKTDWACLGRCCIAGLAIRFDALDRLARMAYQRANQGDFVASLEMIQAVGLKGPAFDKLLVALGYTALKAEDGSTTFHTKAKKRNRRSERRIARRKNELNSPFAKLRDLANAKEAQHDRPRDNSNSH